MASNLTSEFYRDLRQGIVTCFNIDDLKILCADLGINFQNIPGETIEIKAQELIDYAKRHGRLSELLKYCLASRSKYAWPQLEVIQGLEQEAQGILHQPPANWVSPIQRNRWRYKLVAFDLDGTLLRGPNFEFSWELVWKGLGFGTSIQNDLKREYRSRSTADPSRTNRIKAYQDWCSKACNYFKRRGLTRSQVRDLCQPLNLTNNCREALIKLRQEGMVTAIISGGINTFVEDKFPDFREYVDFVFINELVFSDQGDLQGVRATAYDFQGKAEAMDLVSQKVGCTPSEAVFVGDHFNDEAIMLRVHKAIAYPPLDAVVSGVTNVSITEDNLLAIVPHILEA